MAENFSDAKTRVQRATFGALDSAWAIQAAVFAGTIILVVGPLIPVLYQSFVDRPLYDEGKTATLRNYANLFADPEFAKVVVNSLAFALISTLISQVTGVALAILVGRTDLPGRALIGSVVLWPLFLSPLLLSMGWFILYGPAGYVTMLVKSATGGNPWSLYSIAGMSLVAGVAHAPVTIMYCLASTALSDARMEDAARTCGAGPWHTVRYVTLPMLLPAIMFSGVLNFMNSLESLSIPLIFGSPANIRLFMTYIYEQSFSGLRPNYGIIGASATILLGIITVLIWLQRRMLGDLRRFNSVTGKASRPRPLQLGGWRWPAFTVATVYLLVVVVLPFAAVILRAFVPLLSPLVPFWSLISLDNFDQVFQSTGLSRAVTNTLLVALLAAALGTLLALAVAIVSNRSEFRFRRLLEYVALFPRAVPGMIAGVGILYVMLFVPQIGWLRNSIWIIIIAYASRALPTALGAIAPSLSQISVDLDRAARVVGASWWGSMRIVVFRLVTPAMFASFALLFIAFTKEYSTAIFLVAPGSEMLAVSILQAWNQGAAGIASALATIQIAMLTLFLLLARHVFKVKFHD